MMVAFRYNDTRPFSRFLAWWQRADVSHCESVLQVVVDQYRCGSSSLLDGGVRTKEMPLPPEKWRIYEVPADARQALQWFADHAGEGYDIAGLLGFVFRRIKGWLKAWWCSEAVAASMGIRDPWRYDVATLESLCAAIGRRVQ